MTVILLETFSRPCYAFLYRSKGCPICHYPSDCPIISEQVGTPYYVSPEVVRGAGYDWKSDVWSMGCLLYELACLRSPFEVHLELQF
jgi:serine/threonine protein kinase